MIIAKHFTRAATQTQLGLRSATVIPSVSSSVNRYLDCGRAVAGVTTYGKDLQFLRPPVHGDDQVLLPFTEYFTH